MGSLAAAVGSYLFARGAGGRWRVRVEDLDPPRTVAGAADAQLRALEAYGLHWDGEVVYQSRRQAAYRQAVEELRRAGILFPCGCSRREVATVGVAGPLGPVYPGTCRRGLAAGREPRSLRVRVDGGAVEFVDQLLGLQRQDLAASSGDFVVQRADGLFAYQLAVVVDDLAAGVTQVVRGADLLDSTGRQIYLYARLGEALPVYAHLPLVVTAAGQKLSKGAGARPIPTHSPGREETLHRVLSALGQGPDGLEPRAPVGEQLASAVARFQRRWIPTVPVVLPPASG
jgi:glutamyl-Q tRNA(Asp) synthetase